MTSLAPWVSVKNATEALAYCQAAFAAIELERLEDEAGGVVVAQLSIDGADLWIQSEAESNPEVLSGRPIRMILTVDDPDSVMARALAADATEVAPVSEGHGRQIGRVVDPWGHDWEIGRRIS